MFVQSNITSFLSKLNVDADEDEEDDEDEDAKPGKGGKKPHPKHEKKPKKEGKPEAKGAKGGKVKELSKKEQIIRESKIAREKEHAERDIKRLMSQSPLNATVQSSTGRIALDLFLIKHFWSTDKRADALDVWLDLGFDSKSLMELLNSDDDLVERNGDFIYTEMLGDVFEECSSALKAFLAWLKTVQDLPSFQLENMGDRLVPLNHKSFKHARYDSTLALLSLTERILCSQILSVDIFGLKTSQSPVLLILNCSFHFQFSGFCLICQPGLVAAPRPAAHAQEGVSPCLRTHQQRQDCHFVVPCVLGGRGGEAHRQDQQQDHHRRRPQLCPRHAGVWHFL